MPSCAHPDICAPRSRVVNQVAFRDAGTLVSASQDRTVRFWAVGSGAGEEEMVGDGLTLSQDPCDKETAGNYLVTYKADLLLVHLTDTAGASEHEKAEQNQQPIAFFRSPSPISALECAGDKIMVRCQNGEVLQLWAPFLVS